MTRSRQILRWASLAILFGLCLELAARVDDRLTYGAPLWGRYDADILRGLDQEGIPRNVPGVRFEKWRINSLGLRGEEISREKPPGHRRIVCLGQSESFGLYESPEGEWPARLARLVASTHPETEVINASVAGTGRRTRQAYLEKYLLPLGPDVVVLYMNPFNEATEGLLRADPGGVASDRGATTGARALPQLRSVEKLKLRVREAIPRRVLFAVRSWLMRRRLRQLERTILNGRPPIDVLPADNVASFETHVRGLVKFLRAMDVQPILATYPTLVHEENRERDSFYLAAERIYRVWFSGKGLIDIARKLNAATRRVAADLEVPLVEIDTSIPRTTEYFADDVHYTDRGAEIVAERVLDTLERAGALRGSAPAALR